MKTGGTADQTNPNGLFLSGDWGTSSLRIRLTDVVTGKVSGEDSSGMGIRQCFLSWKETGNNDPGKRVAFYLAIVRRVIRNLEERLHLSLQGIPLVLSGMASSSAGMLELPYREIPFNVYHDDLITEWLPAGDEPGGGGGAYGSGGPVLLISGLKSGDDVMRGEETQLIGCLPGVGSVGEKTGAGAAAEKAEADGLYIFPGTHSKHIQIRDGAIAGFTTYMTGEIFGLLSEKSLLAGSVKKSLEAPGDRYWDSFRRGVREAAGANLLQAAFQTRINDLFGRLSKEENFYYLSGLLIGVELGSLRESGATDIYVCCGNALRDHYEKALELMNVCKRVHIFPAEWVDLAAARGQRTILSRIKSA